MASHSPNACVEPRKRSAGKGAEPGIESVDPPWLGTGADGVNHNDRSGALPCFDERRAFSIVLEYRALALRSLLSLRTTSRPAASSRAYSLPMPITRNPERVGTRECDMLELPLRPVRPEPALQGHTRSTVRVRECVEQEEQGS